jgi:hypothetical protein
MTPIAEQPVILVMPSGERKLGHIAVYAPEPDPPRDAEDSTTTWGCVLHMNGLLPRPVRIFGDGSMQPLLLALQLVGYELHAFMSRGGKVLDEDGQGSGVLSMFRVLMRKPGDLMPADPVLAELDAELARAAQEDDEPAP